MCFNTNRRENRLASRHRCRSQVQQKASTGPETLGEESYENDVPPIYPRLLGMKPSSEFRVLGKA